MARPRKAVHIKAGNDNSSSSASSETTDKPPYKISKIWKFLGFLCLLVAIYAGALGYLQTRVNTPFGDEKVTFIKSYLTFIMHWRYIHFCKQ